MDSDLAIQLEDVDVGYRSNASLLDVLRPRRSGYVPVVHEVSFVVPRGEILAIVGRNGSGKSTLIRAIAGVLPIRAGRIRIRGRVNPLLSLGLGFNAELTGRQNIVLGGLAAGRAYDEVAASVEEIVDFAGIGDAVDRPVRTYSSGMRGRLSFSIAVHAKPGILLVDEALATGDAGFSEKAFERLKSLTTQGYAAIIVSHSASQVKELADEAVWLKDGRVEEIGDTDRVLGDYSKWVRTHTNLS